MPQDSESQQNIFLMTSKFFESIQLFLIVKIISKSARTFSIECINGKLQRF
jgi:hypothetical protein